MLWLHVPSECPSVAILLSSNYTPKHGFGSYLASALATQARVHSLPRTTIASVSMFPLDSNTVIATVIATVVRHSDYYLYQCENNCYLLA